MSLEANPVAESNRALDSIRLGEWMRDTVGVEVRPADLVVKRFAGGNSNETYLVSVGASAWVIRRPPKHSLDPSAHSMEREWRILSVLADSAVPVPRVLSYCRDSEVIGAEFILMEYVGDSVPILDELPSAYSDVSASLDMIGHAMVEVLAALANFDWSAAGLEGFGRPDGFLERQVPRWEAQYRRNQVRDIPAFERLTIWLGENLPPAQSAGVMHGDFHLDNCLLSVARPQVRAVVDWEMATIGDPMVDLGLFLSFWGDRPVDPPAMPRVQGVSRLGRAPLRQELAARYGELTGRDVTQVNWYQAFAFWKLAVVVESAWAQHVRGELDTPYSAALEYDVPCMFAEAEIRAGIRETADLSPLGL